ncbi:MAG: hypothetical protein ACRDCB_09945 [Clostridium sp.]
MNIKIEESAKKVLVELLGSSKDEYIRIKAMLACGSSYYELYTDFKREDDMEEKFDSIPFVFDKYTYKAAKNIEIKYDKEIYNNGFYIKDIKK